jgi:cyclo(L-tyrosyl-L-tyrosyl) synthase
MPQSGENMLNIDKRGSADDFLMEPYSDNCRALCDLGEHALVGVSPGNGYFSEERLRLLLDWMSRAFDRVDAVVPDSSLVHTYQALGTPPEQAWNWAQRDARRMHRRIERAWQDSGMQQSKHRIRKLSEFTEHPSYQSLIQQVEQEIARDQSVKEVFVGAAHSALTSQLKGSEPSPAQAEEAARYLIAEMPLCIDTPSVLDVATSVCVYHRVLPITQLTFTPGALHCSSRQAFALVRERGQDAEPLSVSAGESKP